MKANGKKTKHTDNTLLKVKNYKHRDGIQVAIQHRADNSDGGTDHSRT